MISGSPGIGKTTSVKIMAQKLGFHVLELNASDARGKNKIEELLKDMSKCQSIQSAFTPPPQPPKSRNCFSAIPAAPQPTKPTKTLVLMDEVDGCGASDRGGLSALVKIIKETKLPIICICNDIGL